MSYLEDGDSLAVLDGDSLPVLDGESTIAPLLVTPSNPDEWQNIDIDAIDLQARAAGRLLWQFRRSPVLLSILHALVEEIQAAIDMLLDMQRLRMPEAATGENLDAIGRIVGQDRILIDYSERVWMRPDTANQGPDIAPVWTSGAPRYQSAAADDWLYRILIKAKIYRNFCRYGSILEIQSAALRAFGVNVSLQDSSTTLLVQSDIALHILGFLTEERTDSRMDSYFLPPYPATMRIDKTMFLFGTSTFRPDREGGEVDVARVSTGFHF